MFRSWEAIKRPKDLGLPVDILHPRNCHGAMVNFLQDKRGDRDHDQAYHLLTKMSESLNTYPLVNSHIAIESGPVEIVTFPIQKLCFFQFVMWLELPEGIGPISPMILDFCLPHHAWRPKKAHLASLVQTMSFVGKRWQLLISPLFEWTVSI